MPRYGIAPQLSSHWYPLGGAHEDAEICKRGCCWSPYGHSAAARDCHCHDGGHRTVVSAGLEHPVEGLGRENTKGPQTGTEREGKNDE